MPYHAYWIENEENFASYIEKKCTNTSKITLLAQISELFYVSWYLVETVLITNFQSMFHFYTPQNIRKRLVFWYFQGV